jgi:putative spermidine/putrescine transport system permease protein
MALLVVAVLTTAVTSLRPYRDGIIVYDEWTLEHYRRFLLDPYYARVLVSTTLVGMCVVCLTLVLGYIPAYVMARARAHKGLLLALTISPIFILSVIRVFAWTYMLSANGLINAVLRRLGLVREPLSLMFNQTGTIIGLTHVFLPFMILSLLSSMERIDPSVEEAAEGLGAPRFTVLRLVVFPLSLPGVAAGSLLVFTLTVASYITPVMLGSRRNPLIAVTIFDVFHGAGNWPFGSAIALLVLGYALLAIWAYLRLIPATT